MNKFGNLMVQYNLMDQSKSKFKVNFKINHVE